MDFSYLMELLRYPFSLATTQYNYRGKMSQGLTTSSLTACGRAGTPTCWHFSSLTTCGRTGTPTCWHFLALTTCGRAGTPSCWHFSSPHHLWQGRYSYLLALFIPSPPVVGQVLLLAGTSHPLTTCGRAKISGYFHAEEWYHTDRFNTIFFTHNSPLTSK